MGRIFDDNGNIMPDNNNEGGWQGGRLARSGYFDTQEREPESAFGKFINFVEEMGKGVARDVVSTGLSLREAFRPTNIFRKPTIVNPFKAWSEPTSVINKVPEPLDTGVNVFGERVKSIQRNLYEAGKNLEEGKINKKQFYGTALEEGLKPLVFGAPWEIVGKQAVKGVAKQGLKTLLKDIGESSVKYGLPYGAIGGASEAMKENAPWEEIKKRAGEGAVAGMATVAGLGTVGHYAGEALGRLSPKFREIRERYRNKQGEELKTKAKKAEKVAKKSEKTVGAPSAIDIMDIVKKDKDLKLTQAGKIKVLGSSKFANGAYRYNFKTKKGEIRVTPKTKPGTIAHEYAHHLNYKLGARDKFTNELSKFLRGEGRKPKAVSGYNAKRLLQEIKKASRLGDIKFKVGNPSEEFATAFRNYVEKPEKVEKSAPLFAKFVKERLLKEKLNRPKKIISGKKIKWTEEEDKAVEKYIRKTKGINKARSELTAKGYQLVEHYKNLQKMWERTTNKNTRRKINKEIIKTQKLIAEEAKKVESMRSKFRKAKKETIQSQIKKAKAEGKSFEEFVSDLFDIRYHQTSKDIAKNIETNGFKLGNRKSGKYDILPVGVNSKRTTKEIDLPRRGAQIEILFKKGLRTGKFKSREDFEKFLYQHKEGSFYREKLAKLNGVDRTYSRKLQALESKLDKAKNTKQAEKIEREIDILLKKWRKDSNKIRVELQNEATKIANKYFDIIEIEKDSGFLKGATDNTIILNPNKIKTKSQLRKMWDKVKVGEEIKKDKKYKITLNVQDKNDFEKLARIFNEEVAEELRKNPNAKNWRGNKYSDLAKVNIVSFEPKTIAEKLKGKIKGYKLKNKYLYHGTAGDSADAIIKQGFKTGKELQEDAYRGGGYGKIQDSVSFALTPKSASRFAELTKDGKIIKAKLKKNAKIVKIEGIEDAIDLEEYLPFLRKKGIDAVYIGGGEREIVVINPKIIETIGTVKKSQKFRTEESVTLKTLNRIKDEIKKPAVSKQAFRKTNEEIAGKKLTEKQLEKIKELNKRIFGDENIKITKQILTPEGQKALGVYSDGMIKILDGQANPKDTYYHEVVHKFIDVMTTMDEHKEVLISAKRHFKAKTFEEAEERLAESFINYAKTREGVTGKLKVIFDKLLKRFRKYTDNKEVIDEFYNKILKRKFEGKKNLKPIVPENIPKKFIPRKKDKTKYTAKVNTSDDVKKMVEKLEKSDEVRREIQKRGIVSWKETIKQAEEMGIDVSAIRKEAKNAKDFASKIEAIKRLRANKMQELHDFLSQMPRNPNDEQKKEIAKRIEEFLFIDRSLKSLGAEHGRAINILKHEVIPEEYEMYNDLIDKILEIDPKKNDELSYIKKVDKAINRNEKILNYLGLSRSMMTTADLSAPFRQGVFVATRHPAMFAKSFKSMLKQAFSEKEYQNALKEIKNRDTYPLMRKAGLALTELDDKLTQREEAIMSNLVEKIPHFGKIARGSNRAYTGFLNKLRADYFDRIVNDIKFVEKGITDERLKSVASYINSATGRGDLPKFLKKHSDLLNAVFFSPKLIASRIQFFNPYYYYKLDPYVRWEAIKDGLAFLSAGISILTLAKLAGADVGLDPRSADFGKIKVGNTRYDIWGGFQQYIVLLSRLLTGEMVSSTTGREFQLGEGYRATTRGDIIRRFFSYKTSPVTSFVWGLLEGKNSIGKKFDIPVEVLNRFIPMVISDFYDLIKDEKSPAMVIPGVFGVGVQTYTPKMPFMVRDKRGRRKIKWEDQGGLAEDIVNKIRGTKKSNIPKSKWKPLYQKKLKEDMKKAELANAKLKVLKTGKPMTVQGKRIFLKDGVVRTSK